MHIHVINNYLLYIVLYLYTVFLTEHAEITCIVGFGGLKPRTSLVSAA